MENKLFYCKLVRDDIVKQSFYREGESSSDVKEGLEMFEWPKGEWIITPAENDEDNEE